MSASRQGVVTARGVRDGDPAALAGLAHVRGAAVLAYCGRLCDPGAALIATADAFARFRSTVYSSPRLEQIEPETLLLQRTREAAAEHALGPPFDQLAGVRRRMSRRRSATCAQIAPLLTARVNGELSKADTERLTGHLSRCRDCREIEARFDEAERAYREAQPDSLPAAAAAAIVRSLSAAAPVEERFAQQSQARAAPPRVADDQTRNGAAGTSTALPALAFVPPDDPQPEYGETPTELLHMTRAGATGAPPALAKTEAAPATAAAPIPAAAPITAIGRRPEPEPAGALEASSDGAALEHEQLKTVRGRREDRPGRREPATIAFAAVAARRARGALLRPGVLSQRAARPNAALPGPRQGFAARIIGPMAIVVAALTAALVVAGVFHSNSASTHRSAPPAAPAATIAAQPAPVIKKHKHRRHHRVHHRRRTTSLVTPATAPAATAQQPAAAAPVAKAPIAKPAPAPRPSTPSGGSHQPSSVHVLGGSTQQAPPHTGAPSGPGPSGYQPSNR